MLNISFTPDNPEFSEAAKEYAAIWAKDGKRITDAIENSVRKRFNVKDIQAIVFEGISQSNPLKLRASYDRNTKSATLVHELLHIISAEYMFKLPGKEDELSIGLHKQIDLVLYDIWLELYGEQFAHKQVAIESKRTAIYKEAWNWALDFSKPKRHSMFLDLSNIEL